METLSKTQGLSPDIQAGIDEQIRSHIHDGNYSQRINFFDIFLVESPIKLDSPTIATTGNTDTYFIAPFNANVIEMYFSGVDALASNNTNYITWTMTNLGQDGTGTGAILAATDANTTKATGGSAITANTRRLLTLSNSTTTLLVKRGDRIRIRAAATGTLANTVTFPTYLVVLQLT